MRLVVVLIFSAACALAARAQPTFEALTRADGLPSDYVQAVFQDRQGFLWLGTDAGLARYDGRRVVTFTADDGLPHPFVYSIGEGADGTLWVGTFAGLARRVGDRFETVATPLGDDAVYSIQPDGAGVAVRGAHAIAVGTVGRWRLRRSGQGTAWSGLVPLDDGAILASRQVGANTAGPWELLRLDAGGGAPVVVRAPPTLGGARWVAGTAASVIVVGLEGIGIGRVAGDRFVASEIIPSPRVRRVVRGRRGEVYWAGDTGGIWVRDAPGDPLVLLSEIRAQDVVVDREGALWAGTFGQGALRLAGRHLTQLTDRPAIRLAVSERNVFATGSGLLTVDAATLAMRASNPGVDTRQVAIGRTGLMVATGPTVFAVERDPWQTLLDEPNWVAGLDAATDTLAVGVYGSGVMRFVDGVALDTLRQRDGLGTDMVEGLTRTRRGLWVLTRSAGAALVRGARAVSVSRADGLPSSAIFSVAELSDGAVWFGTDRGLGRWDGSRAETVGGDRFGRQRLMAVFERPGTPGIWVVGDRGLFRVLDGAVQARGSLLADEAASINDAGYHAATDRLFLATTAGLFAVDLSRLPTPTIPPKVAFVSVRADDRSVPLARGSVSLAPGRHHVEVSVAALSFGSTASVEYRVGDGAWQLAGPDGRIVFSDLGRGTLRLVARAVGPGGVSEAAVLTVDVAPQWWERRSIRALAVLLLLAVFGLAIREVSQRRLRQEVARLESVRRLQRERARISRDLHDHVGAQLSSLLAGVELAKLARRAGAAPGATDPLALVEADARETIRQLRETIWAINEEALTAGAFCDRLDAFAKARARGRAGHVEVTCAVDPSLALPPAVALALYRVGQEAITNALKHARADRIAATLAPSGLGVQLVVSDDGGFVAPSGDGAAPPGYGLRSMAARAEGLGGRFLLETADGTRVTVDVPLASSPA
ncbi:two-component regulator propeller domain-containing protein [Rubrivirga sp. IMCC43871]|uniref:sensor histidine kinase n=1 Tax=Rubrivirga sp. IMCC43871 TaxID=3391575 RepID=UPI00399012A3